MKLDDNSLAIIMERDALKIELAHIRGELDDETERHQTTLRLLDGHDRSFEKVMDERDQIRRQVAELEKSLGQHRQSQCVDCRSKQQT